MRDEKLIITRSDENVREKQQLTGFAIKALNYQ